MIWKGLLELRPDIRNLRAFFSGLRVEGRPSRMRNVTAPPAGDIGQQQARWCGHAQIRSNCLVDTVGTISSCYSFCMYIICCLSVRFICFCADEGMARQ